MYTHNLDPVLFDLGFIAIRWYSLAYIVGILIGWWLGKRIIIKRLQNSTQQFHLKEFDNLIKVLSFSCEETDNEIMNAIRNKSCFIKTNYLPNKSSFTFGNSDLYFTTTVLIINITAAGIIK